jgi:large subunit ribosomal protein L17e
MVKYSREPDSAVKSSKTRATALRVHYQHMREISHLILGMKLTVAKTYLEDVLEYKQIVPFTKYTGGVGRHAQAKNRNVRDCTAESAKLSLVLK